MENGLSEINVTLTPLMMTMAVPIALAVEFIKALSNKLNFFTTEIRKPLFPLVGIGLAILAFGLAGVENWLVAGVMIGLSAGGGYDLFKGMAQVSKKPPVAPAGVLILCSMLIFGGCMWAGNPKADLLASQKTFAATVDSLTALQIAGKFEPEETEHLTVLIHSGQDYLIAWEEALKAGNEQPDTIELFQSVLDQLLEYNLRKGGE